MAARFSRRAPRASTSPLTPRVSRGAAAALGLVLALWPLAAAQAREPAIEDLGSGRYRVSVAIRTDSRPVEYSEAQAGLREAAQRHCEGRGRARFEGPVEIGSGSRGRTSLALTFGCAAS